MPAKSSLDPITDDWSLDRDGAAPAYLQLEERISELVAAGRLGVGDRLPAERDLAAALGISRMTVRAALAGLTDAGVLERSGGRGTFVARSRLSHDLTRLSGFTALALRQGRRPAAEIRSLEQREAPAAVARALDLTARSPVFRIRRLRLADGEPQVLEDSWVPADTFPGLLGHDLRGSLYDLLEHHYGQGPVRAVERLAPVVADAEQADALGVAPGAALMRVERTAYAADGWPIEHAHDHHRGDRSRFVVEVEAR